MRKPSFRQIKSPAMYSFWFSRPDLFHRTAFFIPGLTLILLGVVALLAPWLIVAAIAFGLFVIGGMLCFLGWQAYKFKRRLENVAKNLKAQVIVQGVRPMEGIDPLGDFDEDDELLKKILFH